MTVAPKTMAQDRLSGRSFATRSEVIARNGMAATNHPLATQVALDILKQGGTAADAAIAANAFLGFADPAMNGIGGDLFAIIWDAATQKLYGLNGSGKSPESLAPELQRRDERIVFDNQVEEQDAVVRQAIRRSGVESGVDQVLPEGGRETRVGQAERVGIERHVGDRERDAVGLRYPQSGFGRGYAPGQQAGERQDRSEAKKSPFSHDDRIVPG